LIDYQSQAGQGQQQAGKPPGGIASFSQQEGKYGLDAKQGRQQAGRDAMRHGLDEMLTEAGSLAELRGIPSPKCRILGFVPGGKVQELPRRTSFSGPALIRLLARLNDADILEPAQSLPDRLSQWLGWTDAIALAAALNGPLAIAAAGKEESGNAGQNEYVRVKAGLKAAIIGINKPAAVRPRGHRAAPVQGESRSQEPVEFGMYRRRYISLQQSMETGITELRSRLRGMLASATPAMASLASLDAAMEQALNEREYRLLAGVPALLEARFHRLRQAGLAEQAGEAATPTPSAVGPGAWLDVFHKDMQSVLLAELDVRLQPVEGLLAALRAC
jgi:hypothetical protein